MVSILENLPLRLEMPLGVDENNDFAAFQGAFKVEVPYGLRASSGPEPELFRAVRISTTATDPAARMHAIMRGMVRFVAATATEPAQLDFRPMPFELTQVTQLLSGSIFFDRVCYRNVDPASAEEAARATLAADPATGEHLDQLLRAYLAGNHWLLVDGGTFLGRPAVDASVGGRRRVDLVVQDAKGYDLNPAHYLYQWPTVNYALGAHPLIMALEAVQHPFIFATKGRMLFVRKSASSATPPFDTAATAASKINDALVHAEAGDVVVVLDSAVYPEKIFMPDGVLLTSVGVIGQRGRIVENPPGFPTLNDPNALSPAVVFDTLPSGPTHVSGFIITSGKGADGGGVSVHDCMNVEIVQNDIHHNLAVRGAGVGITGSRRMRVAANVIRDNTASDGTGLGSFGWGLGGGVFTDAFSSDVTIDDNAIYRNKAATFGGGVAVIESRDVVISRNQIGGPLSSYGNKVTQDRLPYEQSVVLNHPKGGGGGIGIYDTHTRIRENEIQHNEAHLGGGIEFYVNGGGSVIRNRITENRTRPEVPYSSFPVGGDGGGVAVNPTSLTAASAARHRTVWLHDNEIEENHAEEDGGGVYGTAKAIIEISGQNHTISYNTALHNGGGVRVSFGSILKIRGGEVRNNKANLENHPDPEKKRNGGGGIAVRNCRVSIDGCTITGNSVEAHGGPGFAGGGIYLITTDVGGVAPGPGSFSTLLEDAFGYTKAELFLKGCQITNNTANGTRGAGGGLYIAYNDYDVHLKIDNTTLKPNVAQHSDPAKAYNVVLQDASAIFSGLVNDADLPSLTPLNGYETTLST